MSVHFRRNGRPVLRRYGVHAVCGSVHVVLKDTRRVLLCVNAPVQYLHVLDLLLVVHNASQANDVEHLEDGDERRAETQTHRAADVTCSD